MDDRSSDGLDETTNSQLSEYYSEEEQQQHFPEQPLISLSSNFDNFVSEEQVSHRNSIVASSLESHQIMMNNSQSPHYFQSDNNDFNNNVLHQQSSGPTILNQSIFQPKQPSTAIKDQNLIKNSKKKLKPKKQHPRKNIKKVLTKQTKKFQEDDILNSNKKQRQLSSNSFHQQHCTLSKMKTRSKTIKKQKKNHFD